MQGRLVGGRYLVERQLGKGAFGETYVACDTHMPKRPYCVVKHLRPIYTNTEVLETAKRLFHKEAELLAELGEHPQLPRLHAYFTEGEDFYLVQEFIDGHDLGQEMQGPWSPQKVYDFLLEMMNILEFVHSKGVIHRDIKPTNILRRKADNKLVLIDFGAIKEVSQIAMMQSGLMTTSIVIGTKGYMAPEQAYGKPRFGSDIYSVGMMAIEALTGKKLGELDEDADTGELLWKEQVFQASSLVDIVSKMTLYDHKARYKKANQVLTDLMSLTEFRSGLSQNEPSIATEAPTKSDVSAEAITVKQPSVETKKIDEGKQPTIPKTELVDEVKQPTIPKTELIDEEKQPTIAKAELIDENGTTQGQLVTAEDRRVVRRNGTAWFDALLVIVAAFILINIVIKLPLPPHVSLLIVIALVIWAAFDIYKILGGIETIKTIILIILSCCIAYYYYLEFSKPKLEAKLEELLMESARLYYSQGHYNDAIRKLDDLLEKQPDDVDALILRGKAKYKSGDSRGGANDFERAIWLDDSQRSAVSSFLRSIPDEMIYVP